MAVTLTTFAPYKLTNDASAGTATKVTFPPGTVAMIVSSITDDTRFSSAGTDGQAIGDNTMNIVPDDLPSRPIPLAKEVYGSPPVVYFAHDDTVGVTYILPVFSLFPAVV